MRRSIFAFLLLTSASAFAVAPQFWKVTSTEEMLAGEIDGLAITSNGELRPGPQVEKLATFADPAVLSQAVSPDGTRFFGTGHQGHVYRLDGRSLKLVFTAPEPEIYAMTFSEGSLIVGSSPNGKIYRVDPKSGTSTVLFDPKQAYIWALAALDDGSIAAATGVEGKLFRVSRSGEGKIWFDAPDPHLRCIAVAGKNRLLVGGSGQGRIYEVTEAGGRALYDSSLTEISAIYFDPATGIGWAASANVSLPNQAPPKQETAKPGAGQPSSGTAAPSDGGSAHKEGEPSSSVDVSFSFDEGPGLSAAPSLPSTGGEIYRIDRDGFVEVKRRFEREVIYAISGGSNGSVILSSGPLGRIYELQDHEIALIATIPEKQVLSLATDGTALIATTSNNGAIYRISRDAASKGEFRSAAKDLVRFSRFGHYSINGNGLDSAKLAVSFRSGNTDTPDGTWSAWSSPSTSQEGAVTAPSARYIQWRLDLDQASRGVTVDAVTLAYINRNVAPLIDDLQVQDPGVIFLSTNFPGPPQVVEATNPDEYGIFTSLDTPADRSTANPGKKAYRKGFRTVTWKAHDSNGDSLRYDIGFRHLGATDWLKLRDNVDDDQINFDTSELPDGRYQVRLTVSDHVDNPESPLTDSRIASAFVIDNTPPVISWTEHGDSVVMRAADALSPIGRAEYSVDAQKWVRLQPDDGIADSKEETFTLKKGELRGKFVVVRILDSFYNVATTSIPLEH